MEKHQVNKLDWDNFRIQTTKQVGKDNLIKYILNEKNRVITKDYIKNALYNYGIDYTPKDMKLFEIAMTHPSYIYKDWTDLKNFKMIFMSINVVGGDMLVPISKEQVNMAVPLGSTSYERLEFLGDSILRLIISDYLFIRYEEMQEGELTKLRSQLENGSSLAEMTRKIGLNKYVLISRNHEVIKGREKNEKIQCDIFEAFIAALFLDACCISYDEICKKSVTEKGNNKINCFDLISRDRGSGYQKCYDFVVSLIEDEIDLTRLLETDTNYKDKLLQHYHELGWGDPTYGTMDTIIDNNKMGKKYFKMYVRDNDKNIIGWGIGSSKQKGEKLAAKKALQKLKVIPNDNEEEILDKMNNLIYHKKTQNVVSNNKSTKYKKY
jgi:dsRNA-specific ribonuclease